MNFLLIIIGGFLKKESLLDEASGDSLEDKSEKDSLDKVSFISILSSESANEIELLEQFPLELLSSKLD